MEAVLDTNIIIHLYATEQQSLVLKRFTLLHVHEFNRRIELAKHAAPSVLSAFDFDIAQGFVRIHSDAELKKLGILSVFKYHFDIDCCLYSRLDIGEAYAISLARTLGAHALLTDDWKQGGPHHQLQSDHTRCILPLCFHELLLLDYLDGRLETPMEFHTRFKMIAATFQQPPDFRSCISKDMKRFFQPPDKDSVMTDFSFRWMKEYITTSGVPALQRIQSLRSYIENLHK